MEGMDENYIRKYKSLSFKYIDFFENWVEKKLFKFYIKILFMI
jgi:hypothetical protein